MARNLPGKPNKDPWESQSLPVGNGRGKAGSVPVTEYARTDNKADSMYAVYNASGMPFVEVTGADAIIIYVSLATDYKMSYASDWKGKDPAATNKKILAKALKKNYAELRKAHVANYQKLYNRMSISLGKSDSDVASLPTDERIEEYKDSADDPELEATIYQYGRYVLISGSRPGNLPVNLQGIWNDKVHAAWASDYHNNINLQMCYWGAEVGNLSRVLPALHRLHAGHGKATDGNDPEAFRRAHRRLDHPHLPESLGRRRLGKMEPAGECLVCTARVGPLPIHPG